MIFDVSGVRFKRNLVSFGPMSVDVNNTNVREREATNNLILCVRPHSQIVTNGLFCSWDQTKNETYESEEHYNLYEREYE